jgi:hypothetical protein
VTAVLVRKPPAPPPPLPWLYVELPPPPPPPTIKYDKPAMSVFGVIVPDFVEMGLNLYTVYPFVTGIAFDDPVEFKYVIV